jgi:hypothetical protein
MEFIVGSEEEQDYLSQLIQKHSNKIDNEQFQNDNNVDIKEYKYLQNLVFKYCFISNAVL